MPFHVTVIVSARYP